MAVFSHGVSRKTDSYYGAINEIVCADPISSRAGDMHEILGFRADFWAGELFYRPGISRALGWAECMAVIGQAQLADDVLRMVAPALQWAYDDSSQYGKLIGDQAKETLRLLAAYPDTRRALITLSAPTDLGNVAKPCVSSYTFELRDDVLRMIAFVRSWDMISGFIYDTMVMGALTQVFAHCLGVRPGYITAFAASAHVYTNDIVNGKLPLEPQILPSYFKIDTPPIELASPELYFDSYTHWAIRNLMQAKQWARKRPPDNIKITQFLDEVIL